MKLKCSRPLWSTSVILAFFVFFGAIPFLELSVEGRGSGGAPEPVAYADPVEPGPREELPEKAAPQDQQQLGSAPSESNYRAGEGKTSLPGQYLVDVDISGQRVTIYQGEELVREMLASTGTVDKPTPEGSFRIQNRGEWFYNPKYQQGAKYWVSFKDWGIYLFHSVPMDKDRVILAEEAALLGQPASHGCIRLALEDALWFYENIPEGTRVEIHQ